VVDVSRGKDEEEFRAAQVSLGSLGVISTVTMQCVPAYVLHALEEPTRFDSVLATLDEMLDSNDHFMFWWFPHTDKVLAKRWNRTDEAPKPRSRARMYIEKNILENKVFGAICAVGRTFPGTVPALAKLVGGVMSRAEYTERSDKVLTTPRYVRFNEMEQSIPREATAEALREVRRAIEREGFRVNFPVEIRFIASEDAFLSPFHGRASCMVSAMVSKGLPYEPYFRAVEDVTRGLGGRPHWGKLHFRAADELRSLYPAWDRFGAVRAKLDPDGRFRNPYLDRVLGGS
jgi:L-gulonolactone oxidase